MIAVSEVNMGWVSAPSIHFIFKRLEIFVESLELSLSQNINASSMFTLAVLDTAYKLGSEERKFNDCMSLAKLW